VNAGPPEQVVSAGAYVVNVIVPVGFAPPANVAVSLTEPPAPRVAVVVMVGVTGVTVTVSPADPQADVTAALFASPL
jgi:hypothetical protein